MVVADSQPALFYHTDLELFGTADHLMWKIQPCSDVKTEHIEDTLRVGGVRRVGLDYVLPRPARPGAIRLGWWEEGSDARGAVTKQ